MSKQSLQQSPPVLKLLASDLRWTLITALAKSDRRVQELANITHEPMNLVSYHLKQLREYKIVGIRQSEADRRDTYYSLNLHELRSLYQNAGSHLHAALGLLQPSDVQLELKPTRVLFICTHNSARSQMAEALMRDRSNGQLEVFSAGNNPTSVHPNAVYTMDLFGIDIHDQQSKSLETFTHQSFDYVITVCDRARETCPTFGSAGEQIHWGFADPASIDDARERQYAFEQIAKELELRIQSFLLSLSHRLAS